MRKLKSALCILNSKLSEQDTKLMIALANSKGSQDSLEKQLSEAVALGSYELTEEPSSSPASTGFTPKQGCRIRGALGAPLPGNFGWKPPCQEIWMQKQIRQEVWKKESRKSQNTSMSYWYELATHWKRVYRNWNHDGGIVINFVCKDQRQSPSNFLQNAYF